MDPFREEKWVKPFGEEKNWVKPIREDKNWVKLFREGEYDCIDV